MGAWNASFEPKVTLVSIILLTSVPSHVMVEAVAVFKVSSGHVIDVSAPMLNNASARAAGSEVREGARAEGKTPP